MSIVVLVLILFVNNLSHAQVFKLYSTLTKAKDTTVNLKYFKTIDSAIVSKIDSFIIYKSKKLGKLDTTGFIAVVILPSKNNTLKCFMYFEQSTADYYTATNLQDAHNETIGFGFYKDFLVTISFSNLYLTAKVSDPGFLYKTIVFEHLPAKTKKLLNTSPDIYALNSPIISRTYLLPNIQ